MYKHLYVLLSGVNGFLEDYLFTDLKLRLTLVLFVYTFEKMLTLDHRSPMPLRAQVEALLRRMILQTDYQKGALLPDEVTLAAQLGVSRGTVRSGIGKLVFEGVLERKAGVGTRVSNRHLESGIRAWRSFTQEMASKGITVKNFRLDYHSIKASDDAAQALQLEPGTTCWRLDRVRGWDGKPVLQSSSTSLYRTRPAFAVRNIVLPSKARCPWLRPYP